MIHVYKIKDSDDVTRLSYFDLEWQVQQVPNLILNIYEFEAF